MPPLTKDEQKMLNEIQATPYMKRSLELIDEFVSKSKNTQIGYKKVFDELYRILNESKAFVETYLAERKRNGEIKDEKQAIKSIAGNAFSLNIVYCFLKNKEIGNIRNDIFITSKLAKVPSFNEIAVINVDGETQKPDCDLIIYSLNADTILKRCVILSLKTSLRERAGQIYKWKLLMEIATSDNAIKEKYNISYHPHVVPKICFATVNFYNEINNPQHRGMFKFFDQSFIAKNIDADFIARLSSLPDYVNETL